MQCPVCDGEFCYIAKDYQNIPFYQCKCGMGASGLSNQEVYTDPDRFNDWDGTYPPDAIHQNSIFLEIIKYYSSGGKLIDVGTGSGCLPYVAGKHGFRAEGTEISGSACRNVSSKNGIKMHCGTLDDLQTTEKYDVVSMVHLLEHTDNPLTTLEKAKSLLSEQGFLFIIVPNYNTPSMKLKNMMSRIRLHGKPYKHLSCFHHKWFFSLNTLLRAGERTGLTPIYKKTMCAYRKNNLYYSFMTLFDLNSWSCVLFAPKSSKTEQGTCHPIDSIPPTPMPVGAHQCQSPRPD